MKRTASLILALVSTPLLATAAPAPRVVVDDAIAGRGKYAGKVYFFAGDYYVSYDWGRDRVDDAFVVTGGLGPRPLTSWPLGGILAGGIDAAIDGAGKYAGKSYIVKDGQYMRYDWKSEALDSGPSSLALFKLTGDFASRVDAALDGQAQFTGFGYFFRDGNYVKYDWAKDMLVGAPRTITEGWHLPGAFASRIDAAVSGSGRFAGRAYLFRNDEYVRYLWKADRPDGGARKIVGTWPGLQELLQAARAATEARAWIARALPLLRDDLVRAQNGEASTALAAAALRTHFALTTVAERTARLPEIVARFEAVQRTLAAPDRVFRFRNAAEATADGASGAPAYARAGQWVSFTSVYTNYGPKTQAAMALHETIHYVDVAATAAGDFYEHGPQYATLTTAQHMHNPSSYASFACHVFTGTDIRYGVGHPDD